MIPSTPCRCLAGAASCASWYGQITAGRSDSGFMKTGGVVTVQAPPEATVVGHRWVLAVTDVLQHTTNSVGLDNSPPLHPFQLSTRLAMKLASPYPSAAAIVLLVAAAVQSPVQARSSTNIGHGTTCLQRSDDQSGWQHHLDARVCFKRA